jgi:hypothetical protein
MACARTTRDRVARKNDMEARLARAIERVHAGDDVARSSLQSILNSLRSMREICSYDCDAERISDFDLQLYSSDVLLSINDEIPYSVNTASYAAPVFAAPLSSQARESRVVNQVDRLVEGADSLAEARDIDLGFGARLWASEENEPVEVDSNEGGKNSVQIDSNKGGKKLNQNQRRKLAKKTLTQEVSSWLSELCDTVAVTVAEAKLGEEAERQASIEAARLERIRIEEAERQLQEEQRLAREKALKEYNARLALQREHMAQETYAELVESLVKETASAVVKEHNNARVARAQSIVLESAALGELDGVCELVLAILPSMESVLEPTVECFICFQPLNFAANPLLIRSLSCCDGGSFACPACIAKHTTAHPMVAEQHVVFQAATVRRRLKIREFAS